MANLDYLLASYAIHSGKDSTFRRPLNEHRLVHQRAVHIHCDDTFDASMQ